MSTFANNLYTHPLPKNTKILSKDKEVGLLVCNGNHCDYRASMMLSTKLSKNYILAYYKSASVPTADKNIDKDDVKVTVEILNQRDKLGNLIFKIEIFDDGYPAGFDLRCN
ncbi:hypothetical protein OW763_14060 [Clostridium aestuarii]|uniref:Uncharacterized protein n=1 Tax=Clostridium aestuarii TaxID=338193 RepID=A0ABT4D2K3_9CLOT|nr:hypothetical protein [Clostridium aestuarii]MCY6485454.1 hypothetical protein [Clostridium aestuarii]